jgi:hypothetical protein
MNDLSQKVAALKKTAIHEFIEYGVNFVYLSFVFGAFTCYRRLILAEQGVSYLHYGISLLEALVLAKVILILDVFGVGRRFEDRPLIYPTLYKTLVFTACVEIFGVLEFLVLSSIRHQSVAAAWVQFLGPAKYDSLAGCLVHFVAFVPFFALKEIGRVAGQHRLWRLFFRKNETVEFNRPATQKL